MDKILVTGSKGVVGSQLVASLASRGFEVIGIDDMHAPGEIGWEHEMREGEISYARCNVAEHRQLSRIIEQAGPFKFVYHAAAEFGRWNGEDYYEQVWRTNAIGTKNMIRLQEKFRFKMIFFSSSEVYGDYGGVMSESVMDEVEVRQMNDYALSKWVNEQQIHNSNSQHETETVIVRLFNTYGPGEWYHPYRSVNCKFTFHALHGIPITVYKGHTRSSTYLEDTVRTLSNITDNFKPGEAYNIGSIEEHTIEYLSELIWSYSGASADLISFDEPEIMTTQSKKVDISKSEKDLGHENLVTLEKGVKKTVDWMRKYYENS